MKIMINLVILGTMDPEMKAIEKLAWGAGLNVLPARDHNGKPVHAGNAYAFSMMKTLEGTGLTPAASGEGEAFVECNPAGIALPQAVRIDHHATGHPGYGRPPAEFWQASSIGQFYTLIKGDDGYERPPADLLLVAAADHCLMAAYAGKCPGVEASALAAWRAESRAEFQGRTVAQVIADTDAAKQAIQLAKLSPFRTVYLQPCRGGIDDHEHTTYCGCSNWGVGDHPVLDMMGQIIPELPEAACQLSVAVLAGPLQDPDGRQKVVLQAAPPETIAAFLTGYGFPEVYDRYGDPERGFAGGYLSKPGPEHWVKEV